MEPDAYLQMAAVEQKHWFWQGRRAVIKSVLDTLKIPNDASILEIGTGTGGNVDLLKKYGTLHAVEPDDSARKIARKNTQANVLAGSLPCGLPYADEKFDVVCMFDVLEHIEESRKSLRTVARHMKPGAHLLITVPAYEWMWSDWDTLLHHYRRYTRRHLRDEIESAGLTPVKSSHFNFILFPVAVFVRLASKLLGLKPDAGSKIPRPFINTTLRNLFSLERYVVARTNIPFGLSILAVARRPQLGHSA